ncbi:MAG: glycosyltransferase [Bacteroidota bacterium]
MILLTFPGQILLKIRDRARTSPETWPKVSVLVSARNEEKSIKRCVKSLLKLNYPAELLEIILVDDRSTDQTYSIMAEETEGHEHVMVLSTKAFDTTLEAKARGIACAAKQATGEWLFITDADSEVHPDWIRAMLRGVTPKKGIIGGMMIVNASSVLSVIEKMYWAFMLPFAFGMSGLGIDSVAVGPNMAIRNSIYKRQGGLEAQRFRIAEDLALFNMSVNAGFDTLLHYNRASTVMMDPVPSFSHLLSQQRRWMMGPFDQSFWHALAFIVLYGFSFLFMIALILSIFLSPVTGVFVFCIKCLADLINVATSALLSGNHSILKYIPVIWLYTPFVFLFLPISFLMSRTVSWKGEGYNIEYTP